MLPDDTMGKVKTPQHLAFVDDNGNLHWTKGQADRANLTYLMEPFGRQHKVLVSSLVTFLIDNREEIITRLIALRPSNILEQMREDEAA